MNIIKNKLTSMWAKINGLICFLLVTAPQYFLTTMAVSTDTSFMDNFNALVDEYSTEITIVLSISMILSIAIFIYHTVQLNAHADNPNARSQDIKNLLITGFCLAGQGSVTACLAIIYYMFA